MGSCNSCDGSSCSTGGKSFPPGIFQKYDLNQPVSEGNMIWLETEYRNDIPNVTDNTLEIIGKIRESDDSRMFGVIFGHNEVKELTKTIFSYGINTIYHIKDADLSKFDECQYARCIADVISRVNPATLFIPSSDNGKILAERIASLTDVPVFFDCSDISIKDRVLSVTVNGITKSGTSFPQVAVVRKGSFPVPLPKYGTEGTVFYRENCCKCRK